MLQINLIWRLYVFITLTCHKISFQNRSLNIKSNSSIHANVEPLQLLFLLLLLHSYRYYFDDKTSISLKNHHWKVANVLTIHHKWLMSLMLPFSNSNFNKHIVKTSSTSLPLLSNFDQCQKLNFILSYDIVVAWVTIYSFTSLRSYLWINKSLYGTVSLDCLK